jgi:hypothetical protein
MAAPPPTAYTLEEREAAIREERAKRLPKHQGHTPQERAALCVWEEKREHEQRLEQLQGVIDHQRSRLPKTEVREDAPFTWKNDVRVCSILCISAPELGPGASVRECTRWDLETAGPQRWCGQAVRCNGARLTGRGG